MSAGSDARWSDARALNCAPHLQPAPVYVNDNQIHFTYARKTAGAASNHNKDIKTYALVTGRRIYYRFKTRVCISDLSMKPTSDCRLQFHL